MGAEEAVCLTEISSVGHLIPEELYEWGKPIARTSKGMLWMNRFATETTWILPDGRFEIVPIVAPPGWFRFTLSKVVHLREWSSRETPIAIALIWSNAFELCQRLWVAKIDLIAGILTVGEKLPAGASEGEILPGILVVKFDAPNEAGGSKFGAAEINWKPVSGPTIGEFCYSPDVGDNDRNFYFVAEVDRLAEGFRCGRPSLADVVVWYVDFDPTRTPERKLLRWLPGAPIESSVVAVDVATATEPLIQITLGIIGNEGCVSVCRRDSISSICAQTVVAHPNGSWLKVDEPQFHEVFGPGYRPLYGLPCDLRDIEVRFFCLDPSEWALECGFNGVFEARVFRSSDGLREKAIHRLVQNFPGDGFPSTLGFMLSPEDLRIAQGFWHCDLRRRKILGCERKLASNRWAIRDCWKEHNQTKTPPT